MSEDGSKMAGMHQTELGEWEKGMPGAGSAGGEGELDTGQKQAFCTGTSALSELLN